MKKSMAKQGFNIKLPPPPPGADTVKTVAPEFDPKRNNLDKPTRPLTDQEIYNKYGKFPGNAPTKQMAPIDPVTGMPMQPQMMNQPNTVGMPGTTPMPAGIAHTLPEHGIQAAGNKMMSPYTQKQKKDRKQIRTQKKVDKAIKKGKMLNIAVQAYDKPGTYDLQGNFKLDPTGVTVGKGGYIAEIPGQNFSLTDDGVVKEGTHSYSKQMTEPYKLYANQDLIGQIGKKVNFKKKNKR